MSRTEATAPRGGIARVSRRVMNLAYILTQNARRHGDRPGFIWNEKAWSWRHIDQNVSALAAALAARGIGTTVVLGAYGCMGDGCAGDFDGDGLVGSADIVLFLAQFGEFCTD